MNNDNNSKEEEKHSMVSFVENEGTKIIIFNAYNSFKNIIDRMKFVKAIEMAGFTDIKNREENISFVRKRMQRDNATLVLEDSIYFFPFGYMPDENDKKRLIHPIFVAYITHGYTTGEQLESFIKFTKEIKGDEDVKLTDVFIRTFPLKNEKDIKVRELEYFDKYQCYEDANVIVSKLSDTLEDGTILYRVIINTYQKPELFMMPPIKPKRKKWTIPESATLKQLAQAGWTYYC